MNDNSKGKKITRHEEREQAFILLFEQIFQKNSIDIIAEDAKDARDLIAGKYTLKLAHGVEEKMEELDEIIEKNLKGWKKDRISKVALTVLRMAIYEMLYVKNVDAFRTVAENIVSRVEAGYPENAFRVAEKRKGSSVFERELGVGEELFDLVGHALRSVCVSVFAGAYGYCIIFKYIFRP